MANRLYVFYSNNDEEKAALAAEGFANGSLNDCQFAYLGSLGLTGSLTDRLLEFITNPPTPGTDSLLMEIGDYLLLETGDKILLET